LKFQKKVVHHAKQGTDPIENSIEKGETKRLADRVEKAQVHNIEFALGGATVRFESVVLFTYFIAPQGAGQAVRGSAGFDPRPNANTEPVGETPPFFLPICHLICQVSSPVSGTIRLFMQPLVS
jgi:hypothetical protein